MTSTRRGAERAGRPGPMGGFTDWVEQIADAYLRKDAGLLGALLTRRVRVRGPLRLLKAFGRCFP